jgi:hypothetical protein
MQHSAKQQPSKSIALPVPAWKQQLPPGLRSSLWLAKVDIATTRAIEFPHNAVTGSKGGVANESRVVSKDE